MYCSNCGKALREGDRFCSFCGKKIENANREGARKTEEIIFNPSFDERIDEQRKQNYYTPSNKPPQQARLTFDSDPEFIWNLHEFPEMEGKKTEAVDFDWGTGELQRKKEIARRQEQRREEELFFAKTANKIHEECKPDAIAEVVTESKIVGRQQEADPEQVQPRCRTEAKSREIEAVREEYKAQKIADQETQAANATLEEALFSDVQTSEARAQAEKIDKFYTFNQKNEEFQKLLDREYEKIKSGHEPDLQIKEEPLKEEFPKADWQEPELAAGEEERPDSERSGDFNPVAHLQEAAKERELITKDELIPDVVDNESLAKRFDTMELCKDLMGDAPQEVSTPLKDETSFVAADQEEKPFSRTQALDELFGARLDVAQPSESKIPPIEKTKQEMDKPKVPMGPMDLNGPVMLGMMQEIPASASTEDSLEEEAVVKPKAEAQVEASEDKAEDLKPMLYFDNLKSCEEDPKKITFGKVILIIIIVLLLLEAAILGIKILAPSSGAANFINEKLKITYEWILGVTDQKEEPADDATTGPVVPEKPEVVTPVPPAIDTAPEADKAALVAGQLSVNKNIQSVTANETLTYIQAKNYGIKSINSSTPISNNLWYQKDDGTPVYYDQALVGTLIAFDSQWIDYVNEKNESVISLTKKGEMAYKNAVSFSKVGKVKETFNSLELGEIRQSEKGFYVWTKETIQIMENGVTSQKSYRWIYYLEPLDKEMKVVSYYKY